MRFPSRQNTLLGRPRLKWENASEYKEIQISSEFWQAIGKRGVEYVCRHDHRGRNNCQEQLNTINNYYYSNNTFNNISFKLTSHDLC